MRGENLWHAEACCSDVPSSEEGSVMAPDAKFKGRAPSSQASPLQPAELSTGDTVPAVVLDSSTASLCCGAGCQCPPPPSAHTAVSPNSLLTSYPVLSASWRAQVHRGQVPLLKEWSGRLHWEGEQRPTGAAGSQVTVWREQRPGRGAAPGAEDVGWERVRLWLEQRAVGEGQGRCVLPAMGRMLSGKPGGFETFDRIQCTEVSGRRRQRPRDQRGGCCGAPGEGPGGGPRAAWTRRPGQMLGAF